MSEWRSSNRGSHRGHGHSERGWRSGGRGQGRGATPPSSSRGTAPSVSKTQPSEIARASTRSDPVSARRRMDLMASVSRSSGLEKDGDDLKNYKTQEEYRSFIQEKVDNVFKNHSRAISETENEKRQRADVQENVLILFRKLREGVASSARKDAFALEAYETSLYLSVIFESPKQTISIIPHLFPPRSEHPEGSQLPPSSIYSVLISLLHHLVTSYPSQSSYRQQLDSIPTTLLPRQSEASVWLSSLTKCLRTRNYAKFAGLSQKSSFQTVLDASRTEVEPKKASTPVADPDKGLEAVLSLLDALRKKASDTTWAVIRAAYRELSFDQASAETKFWLSRTICLESVLDHNLSFEAENWLVTKIPAGHVRRKEGVEGRWIVCKAR